MDSNAIYKQLTSVFAEVFDDETIVLTPATTAEDVDEWDSLNHIRLIVSVEQTFKIKFSTPEIAKLKNVGELVGLIASKL